MGKGNRTSKYQEAYAMSGASSVKSVNANGKKKDMSTFWTTVVIAVLLIGSILLFALSSTGVVDRSTKLAATDNYKVDGAMITYFESQLMNQAFNTYLQYYYQMTQDYNTAYTYAQQYAVGQDYRANAVDLVKELLILCEGANAAGITLDAEDNEIISENLDQIEESGGYAATFGKGVMKGDIRKSLELQVLANKFHGKLTDDIEAAITSEELDAYMEANKASFYITDYLTAELSILSADYDGDKEGFAAAKALVDEYKAKFEAAKTVDEFNTLLIEYTVKSQFDGLVATEIDSAIMPEQADLNNYEAEIVTGIVNLIVKGEEMTLGGGEDGTLEKAIATIKETLVGKCNTAVNGAALTQAYVDSTSDSYTEIAAWLVSSDRAAGDVNVTSISDETEYTYNVYMVQTPVHINDELSRSVGHILIAAAEGTATEEEKATAKAKAEEVLAEYEASAKTEESFEEIGWKYTSDSSVLYDNVLAGEMTEEFDNWLFDASRKDGDTGIVLTPYGYHVMLYRGEEAISTANAKSGVLSEKYSEYLKDNEGKVTIHSKYVTAE